jgi:hypothetical protein
VDTVESKTSSLEEWRREAHRLELQGKEEQAAEIRDRILKQQQVPWTVLRGDDKKRTRINAIRALLHPLPYDRKDARAIGALDPKIIGGPDIVTQAGKDH